MRESALCRLEVVRATNPLIALYIIESLATLRQPSKSSHGVTMLAHTGRDSMVFCGPL